MEWEHEIAIDQKIHGGKPVIAGTALTADQTLQELRALTGAERVRPIERAADARVAWKR